MHAPLHSVPLALQQATSDKCLCRRPLDTYGQVWISLLWGHCSFLLGPGAHNFLFVPPRVCFPVLCKFWGLYGGLNGNLLQEGLCHTQVCCTQSPRPCGRHRWPEPPQVTLRTQFCLSLCGVSGSWYAQGWFEPSELFWQVWGLIWNIISPPYHLAGASPLSLDVVYLLTVARAPRSRRSCTYRLARASPPLDMGCLLCVFYHN